MVLDGRVNSSLETESERETSSPSCVEMLPGLALRLNHAASSVRHYLLGSSMVIQASLMVIWIFSRDITS